MEVKKIKVAKCLSDISCFSGLGNCSYLELVIEEEELCGLLLFSIWSEKSVCMLLWFCRVNK